MYHINSEHMTAYRIFILRGYVAQLVEHQAVHGGLSSKMSHVQNIGYLFYKFIILTVNTRQSIGDLFCKVT